MTGPTDTSPEVQRLLIAGYRQMPAGRKGALVTEAFTVARRMHAAGHRQRHSDATAAGVNREWAHLTLGPGPWTDRMEFAAMSHTPAEQLTPIRHVVAVLDDLNVRYAVGGSYASSVHGVPRYTQDADLAVEPFPGKERLFALRFPPAEYYADEGMIRDAVARRATFNLLHLPTMFKIDVFVQKDRPFDRELFARRVTAPVFGPDHGPFRVVSAEDTVLLKLEWFRPDNEVSDRQWSDILGVLRTQAGRLDYAYLDHWAAELGVADLLGRARAAG